MEILGKTVSLRSQIVQILNVAPEKVDLIELRRANLVMRAAVAEIGIPIAGDDSLAWSHFLIRTWCELEFFYWEQSHAS